MKGNKVLKGIILVGIFLRMILWAFQESPEGDDGQRYLNESINIVEHNVFSVERSDNPQPSAHDMPLWPGLMAVAYCASNHSVKATQYIAGAVNIIFVIGSVLFLISMLRAKPFHFKDKQLAASAGVLLFMPESIMYSLFHMPDQLAVFALIGALWFYFRTIFYSSKYFMGAVILFLVSIYAKPICIPLAFALLAAIPFVRIHEWKKNTIIAFSGMIIIVAGLIPWVMRNKVAFGTAGLTSISGTNLYSCNWGRLVETLTPEEQEAIIKQMNEVEENISGYDLMKRSQLQGEYAKRELLRHMREYIIYTIKKHPRFYAGTGSVAMLRYLGLERICDALDSTWGSNNARGVAPVYETPYTATEKGVGLGLQIFSWLILSCGYILVVVGAFKGFKAAMSSDKAERFDKIIILLCPILSLVLLAIVIGPITATRYRFIMIPFFAILAGYALKSTDTNFNKIH